MDTEFHYWITGIVAREAGFDQNEAKTIAHSSEYVDENDVSITVLDRSSPARYVNFVSQTMNILQPKNELMRIYPIFHFVPGDPGALSARRRDGKMHLFNTTPNSEFANELLKDAFTAPEELRLYRIGIATHAFVDTWAHQNFTGWHEHFNALGLNVVPNIGHADAKHHPDWVGHRWADDRLVDGDINNNHRFLSAASELFNHYCDYLVAQGRYPAGSRPPWDPLQQKLVAIMGTAVGGDKNYYQERRIGRYLELAPWLGPGFSEAIWFDEAIETEVRGLRDSKDSITSPFFVFKDHYYWRDGRTKERTNWYRFQTAVKAHERYALELLSPRFKQIGIDLRGC